MRVAFFHVRQDPVYALKMIESVRRNMDCEIVQNTDMETPAIDGCTVMRSKDEDNGNYMMWRMRGLSRLDGDVVSGTSLVSSVFHSMLLLPGGMGLFLTERETICRN